MKLLIISSFVLLFVFCTNKQQVKTYMYKTYMSNNDSCSNNDLESQYYVREFIFVKDTIKNMVFALDEKFKKTSYHSSTYIIRNKDLFRLDQGGKELKYLTIANNENVFYPIVLLDPENQPDTVYGANHMFISKCQTKELDGDLIQALKFFVRESKFEDSDRSYVGESDYLIYYTYDFILIKKEYIGILCGGYNTERLTFDLSKIEKYNTALPHFTFSIY